MKYGSRILYSSTEVRSAIINLFRTGREKRIAISAFVGDGADAYLPHPQGMHLICSPTPGATNPNAIRRLMSRGVHVEFVDALHMKVYYAKGVGAVLTSANLSTNAMGIGGLKEAGILVGPDQFDINRLLRQLNRRPAEPELHKLDKQHKKYFKRVGWYQSRQAAPSFREWFEAPSPAKWKIFYHDVSASGTLSEIATLTVRKEFDVTPYDWMWNRTSVVKETDWVLCAPVADGKMQRLEWFFGDRVIKVPKSDRHFDPENPYEVVQVHGPKHYPPPPFTIEKGVLRSMNKVLECEIEKRSSPYTLARRQLRKIYEDLN